MLIAHPPHCGDCNKPWASKLAWKRNRTRSSFSIAYLISESNVKGVIPMVLSFLMKPRIKWTAAHTSWWLPALVRCPWEIYAWRYCVNHVQLSWTELNTERVEINWLSNRVGKMVPKQALVLRKKCYIILHTVPMFSDRLEMSKNRGTRDPTHSTLTPPRRLFNFGWKS